MIVRRVGSPGISPSFQSCYDNQRHWWEMKRDTSVMRNRLTQSRWSRLIPLTGALALLATSAFAQMPTPGLSLQGENKSLTPEELERQKKLDDDYKAATTKIPNQKQKADPWADVRSATPTAPAPKKKLQ